MMRSRKQIGIVGWNTGENSFGITKPYAEFFATYGDIIVLGPSTEVQPGLDLLVLPGGRDISSYIYGELPSFYNSEPDVMKEFFLKCTLSKYVDARIPIFGICLGMQQLNVHFGGKMLQHISHAVSDPKDRGELVNELVIPVPEIDKFLRQGMRGKALSKPIMVNSLHHQAVDAKTLSPDLMVIATNKEDHVIEIIKHRTLPIWGVQYHPEEIADYPSFNIIQSLLYDEHPAVK